MANTETPTTEMPASTSSLDQILVELHDAQRSYSTSDTKDASLATRQIVETVAQLIEYDVTDYQRDTVADILLSLVRQAEMDLRACLSERLCAMGDVPEDLVLYLAHDQINVARPMLKNSPVLTDTDLLYIIQSKPSEYWQAIAQRKLLDSCVVDALVERNDETTAYNLLLNEKLVLKISSFEAFAELCKYSEKLAEPLLARKELPQRVAMDLYWHVSEELRKNIVREFKIPKQRLEAAFQDALQDFSDTAKEVEGARPSALMLDVARNYGAQERIDDKMLLTVLRRGQTRFFVALMAQRSGLSIDTVFEIMRQVGGQGLAVACKATRIKKENFVSIFLLSRSLMQGDRPVDALELRKALKYYDAMPEELATDILANSIIKK